MHGLAALLLMSFLAIAYAVFLLVWIAIGYLLEVRHKLVFALASAPVFAVLVIGCTSWLARPSALFQEAFGFAAPPSVVFRHSSYWCLGDCGHTYLHFVTDPSSRVAYFRFVGID